MSDNRRDHAEALDEGQKLERWRAIDIGGAIACESTSKTEYSKSAHCKACALADVITKYGGDADLRGLHVYGPCYQFLAVIVRQSRRGVSGEQSVDPQTERS